MKDLTGQRFGRLVALRPTEQRKQGFVVWECICDCGNTAYAVGSKLTNGNTKSCGCLQKENAAKGAEKSIVDLTGQRFGRLVAIRPTAQRRQGFVVWECICDCGNTAYVAGSMLSCGNTSSCGCLRKEIAARNMMKNISKEKRTANQPCNCLQKGSISHTGTRWAVDITGQKFGLLTAVRPTDQRRSGAVVWECICDCGNTVFANGSTLRNGNTRSCGCLQKAAISHTAKQRAINIAGQKFGLLTAVRPTDERINNAIAWECKCDCGNLTLATSYQLRKGLKKSCGCLRKSERGK